MEKENEWAAFAFAKVTEKMIKIDMKAPPSEEAKAHGSEAVGKCTAAIRECKQFSRTLGSLSKVPDHLRTWKPTVARPIDLMKLIDEQFVCKLDNMIMLGTITDETSTSLKQTLCKLAPYFDELSAINKTLGAAVRQLPKPEKPKQD